MNYTFEKAEKSSVKITMNFDKTEWENANQKAYEKSKGKFAINGFRKGKVPKHVIENYYGKGVFFEDALNDLYVENFDSVCEKEKDNFTVVGQPELSVDKLDENGVTLIALTPVKPEIKLGAYKGIKIKKVEYNVTDEDVEKELTALQQRNSREVSVENRSAQNGDVAVIDFSGSVDGVKFDGGTAEKYSLELGSNSFIPGFEDQVCGMNIGEEKDVKVKFPDDYGAGNLKGKDAVFAVKLHEIKTKELPEINDEFIKDAAGAESLEKYKTETKEKLVKDAEKKADGETENNIIDAISKTVEVELPQAMIENQIDSIIKNFEYRLMYQGLKLEDYLKYTNTNMEDFRKGYAEQAKKTVISQLAIDKIIREENIKASEEDIEKEIAKQAEEAKKSVEEFKSSLTDRQKDYIENDIIINKLFDFLKANNTLEK